MICIDKTLIPISFFNTTILLVNTFLTRVLYFRLHILIEADLPSQVGTRRCGLWSQH